MTEEALKNHIILWGVESAAPQFGTSITVLKDWMRGDNALPNQVWDAWVRFSSMPPDQRPPIVGQGVGPDRIPENDQPALMTKSALASRVLAEPNIAARIKAETTKAAAPQPPPERVKAPIEFSPELPPQAPSPKSNGQQKAVALGTVAFCCPTDRDFPPATFECFSVLIRIHRMPLIMKAETLLVRGRNIIAERFLSTKCEWSLWLDSDMIVPFGNPDWFRDKSKITNLRPEQYGFDVLKRLLGHRQDFVGGVYAARTEHSQMIIQPDIDPRTEADRQLADQIRKNQAYGLKDVGWLGFGCVLVHRRVFEAIGRTDPEIRNGKASFFDTQGSKGEDIRFSERAAAAGFRARLDCELFVGHIGRKCFRPQDTAGVPAPKVK
jgi:hypothetical protein